MALVGSLVVAQLASSSRCCWLHASSQVLLRNGYFASQRLLCAASAMARSLPRWHFAKRSVSLRRTKKCGSVLKSKAKPIKLRKYNTKRSQNKAEEASVFSRWSRTGEKPRSNIAYRADIDRHKSKGKGKGKDKGKGKGKCKTVVFAAPKPFKPYYDGKANYWVVYGGKHETRCCLAGPM